MKLRMGVLLLMCLFMTQFPEGAWAQTQERIELRLRVRWLDGAPVEGHRIGLTRLSDGAPMGERLTGAEGYAVWQVEPGDIYEFETPYRYGELAQEAMADNGVGNLSVYTGWMGQVSEQMEAPPPVEMRIVLANEGATGRGYFAFLDRAAADELPSPDIPGITSPIGRHHVEEVVQESRETAVVAHPPEDDGSIRVIQRMPAPDAPFENGGRQMWLLALVIVVSVIVAGLIWLWPALQGGMR